MLRSTKKLKSLRSKSQTMTDKMIHLMRRRNGATLADLVELTGWQTHSVRGAISGTLRKKLKLPISSESVKGRGRVYRIEGLA